MSTGRRSVHRSDRPRYPDLADELGEDPARYLHEPDETAFARIRGIVDTGVLDAWFAVETDLGPRREVIAALNARRQALRGDGESGD